MSWESFSDECAGCRPIIIDPATMQSLPMNSKPMQAIMRVWKGTTLQERQAWHRFTCQNSRAPLDLCVIKDFQDRLTAELEKPS